MSRLHTRPPKVEMDFISAQFTGFGGWLVLGQMAERLDLPPALSAKQRAGGTSGTETLWSLIASLVAGNGALSVPGNQIKGNAPYRTGGTQHRDSSNIYISCRRYH